MSPIGYRLAKNERIVDRKVVLADRMEQTIEG